MKILHNANIYSPGQANVTALAINNGYFIALGSEEDLRSAFPYAEQVINLGGRTIWPGLTDAHLHLQHLAESMTMVDCETTTRQECLERVRSAALQLPQNAWVRGHGWNQNRWDRGFGTAADLDAVCNHRPAYLTAKSLHAAWANSQALALAGINAKTPDPPGGIIQRDETGAPTGILFEAGAMQLVEKVIPPISQQALNQKIQDLIPKLREMGLVSVHDFDGFDCWKALLHHYQKGELKLRVRKNIPFDHLDAFINAGLQTDFGDDWLHLGGLKLFADGALGPQTAAMNEPFEGSSDTGSLLLSEDEIVDIGKKAVNHSIALTIHAIGDRANHIVLNAFESLRRYEEDHNLPHLKHRIEHVQILDPEDLPRLAKLDIVASVQPIHAPSDSQMADQYLGTRAKNAYAYHSLLESGAVCVFGSDAPVESVNPFLGIHAAVTRRKLNGTPAPDGWHPYQRLSLDQAIEGFSRTPAEIANQGDRLGRIAAGFKADFLILEDDPFKIDPNKLSQIKPLATFIGGKCRYGSTTLSTGLKQRSVDL